MAIEIKGLKADALTARANLDKLRAAYAKFNEAAPAHAADVEGLATTIGGMQSDLEFAATVMGNSAGESEKLADTIHDVPARWTADAGKINAEPPQGQQTTVNDPLKPSAFSIEAEKLIVPTTDRVALGPHPDQPEGQQTAWGQTVIPATVTTSAQQATKVENPPVIPASQQAGSANAPADPQPNGADVLVRAVG